MTDIPCGLYHLAGRDARVLWTWWQTKEREREEAELAMFEQLKNLAEEVPE